MHKLITILSLSVRLLTTGLLPFFYLLIVNFLIGQNVMMMVKRSDCDDIKGLYTFHKTIHKIQVKGLMKIDN